MKILWISMLFLINSAWANEPKRILMVINEGFQVDEYFEPKRLFESKGYKITTASRYGETVKPGKKYSDSKSVEADLRFDQIKITDFHAITFTGGGGAWTDYFPNKSLHKVLASALQRKDMIVGLICAGAGLLATANNLDGKNPIAKGRHVTGYGEVEGLLRTLGQVNFDSGDPSKPFVVQDGNLVTGRDPSSSIRFAEKIISLLEN